MDQIAKTPRMAGWRFSENNIRTCIIHFLYPKSFVLKNILILLLVVLFLEVVGVVDEVDKLPDGIRPLPSGVGYKLIGHL